MPRTMGCTSVYPRNGSSPDAYSKFRPLTGTRARHTPGPSCTFAPAHFSAHAPHSASTGLHPSGHPTDVTSGLVTDSLPSCGHSRRPRGHNTPARCTPLSIKMGTHPCRGTPDPWRHPSRTAAPGPTSSPSSTPTANTSSCLGARRLATMDPPHHNVDNDTSRDTSRTCDDDEPVVAWCAVEGVRRERNRRTLKPATRKPAV